MNLFASGYIKTHSKRDMGTSRNMPIICFFNGILDIGTTNAAFGEATSDTSHTKDRIQTPNAHKTHHYALKHTVTHKDIPNFI